MPSDEPRQLTFQLLLGSALPPSTSSDCLSRYNSASAELLGTLGSTAKLIDHSTHLRNAAHALITMANILLANASVREMNVLRFMLLIISTVFPLGCSPPPDTSSFILYTSNRCVISSDPLFRYRK